MATTRTWQQLIEMSLRELGIGVAGEPIQPEDIQYGMLKINDFIDTMKTYRLLIHELLRQEKSVAANAVSYTVGVGGDIDIQRPEQILKAGFVNTSVNPTEPLETEIKMLSDEEWAGITLKSLTSTISWGAWYQRSMPLARLYLYPRISVANKVALYVPTAIEEFVEDENGLAVVVILPPGYRRMIVTNLALEEADAFSITPSPNLVRRAAIALDFVTRSNATSMTLRLPAGLTRRGRGYNILTNQ